MSARRQPAAALSSLGDRNTGANHRAGLMQVSPARSCGRFFLREVRRWWSAGNTASRTLTGAVHWRTVARISILAQPQPEFAALRFAEVKMQYPQTSATITRGKILVFSREARFGPGAHGLMGAATPTPQLPLRRD
jgi:hypothetical protein